MYSKHGSAECHFKGIDVSETIHHSSSVLNSGGLHFFPWDSYSFSEIILKSGKK